MKLNYLFKALLAISLSSQAVMAETISGIVEGVTDGDTIYIRDDDSKKHTIRLFAIDAPETSCHLPRPTYKDVACVENAQNAGKESKDNLVSMIFGKYVYVFLNDTDKYGRQVGTVYLNKQDINLQQVKEGYAWVFTRYASSMNPSLLKKYQDAEAYARERKLGLWQYNNPLPPWEYRHATKKSDTQ